MKYDELINLCIKCIKEFDSVKMTVDTHSENFINYHKKKLEDTE